MNRNILEPQKNYKNIYLFSSIENFGEKREKKLNNIHFDDDDCIVLFNSPNRYVQKLLKNKTINYCFCRGFKNHLVNTLELIKNNIFDKVNTEIIHEEDIKEKSVFSNYKNYNLRNNIYIHDTKIDSSNYFKNMGYVPDRPNHYSASMGFKAIIMLKLLYPDAHFYLIGFEYMKNKIILCHNHKYEMEYVEKNIQYSHI